MLLKLWMFLPDQHEWPLVVEKAIVRWVMGQEFDLEFLSMSAPELTRIRHLYIQKRDAERFLSQNSA
ncbi:MAG TPA: hypothetical protein VIU63_07930 [Nitrospira sp.]